MHESEEGKMSESSLNQKHTIVDDQYRQII